MQVATKSEWLLWSQPPDISPTLELTTIQQRKREDSPSPHVKEERLTWERSYALVEEEETNN